VVPGYVFTTFAVKTFLVGAKKKERKRKERKGKEKRKRKKKKSIHLK
jgi:hypothetical protein